MEMRKRAQSAFEITLVTGVMFLIFIVLFVILTMKTIESQNEQELALMEDLASAVADEITMAAAAEHGYTRIFEVPDAVSGINFSIYIITNPSISNHSELIVRPLNHTFEVEIVRTLPVDIIGLLLKGENRIQKYSDTICLNAMSCP